jgi:hypothetical protein
VVANADYVVEYSGDLQKWSQLKTVRCSTDQSYVLEEELTSGPRFYRVVKQSPLRPFGKATIPGSDR